MVFLQVENIPVYPLTETKLLQALHCDSVYSINKEQDIFLFVCLLLTEQFYDLPSLILVTESHCIQRRLMPHSYSGEYCILPTNWYFVQYYDNLKQQNGMEWISGFNGTFL